MTDEHPLLMEAERRYQTDAEFHARAEMAVGLVAHSLRCDHGARLDKDDRTIATLAACAALVMAERPVSTSA